MLKDVVYYVEPADKADASLTSAHYFIVADSTQAPNTSCGMHSASLTILLGSHTVRPMSDTQQS